MAVGNEVGALTGPSGVPEFKPMCVLCTPACAPAAESEGHGPHAGARLPLRTIADSVNLKIARCFAPEPYTHFQSSDVYAFSAQVGLSKLVSIKLVVLDTQSPYASSAIQWKVLLAQTSVPKLSNCLSAAPRVHYAG